MADETKPAEGETADKPVDQQTTDAKPNEEAKPVEQDWRDDRLKVLTAQKHEVTGKLTDAQARIAELEAKLVAAAKSNAAVQAPLSETEIARRIQAEAQPLAEQLAAQREFDRLCNDAANAGRQAFPDFDSKVGELRKLVDPRDQEAGQRYNAMIQAVLETGAAPQLLHELGSDLNLANRMMQMTPLKMAVELTKLATGSGEGTREISGAPKPIRPISGSAASHEQIDPRDPARADNITIDEWMRRREAQMATPRRSAPELR